MTFKTIVSGEPITVEDKFASACSAEIKTTNWFSTNHMVRTMDHTTGFWRRWMFWEFTRPRADGEVIIRIDEPILADEREAIAAWAVEALGDLVENNAIRKFASCEEVIMTARKRSDTVLWFMEDWCKVSKKDTKIAEFYSRYRSMVAVKGGGKPVSYLNFIDRLKQNDYVVDNDLIYGIEVRS
jgi:putative DNA primase/helicase